MINKEEINNMSAYDLLFKISWYSKEVRMELYQDKEIAQKLSTYLIEAEKDSWRYFRKLVQWIDMEEIFEIFSKSTLDNLFTKNYSYRFLGALLEYDMNKALDIFLKNDYLFIYLNKNMSLIYSLITNLTCSDAMKIINKNKDLNIEGNYRFVMKMNVEEQRKLIDEIDDDNILVSVLQEVEKDVKKDFYSNNPRAIHVYKKLNGYSIADLSEIGVKFNQDIINDSEFFEKIKDTNIIHMRYNLNKIQQTNPSNNLREKLINYYDSIIDSYDAESRTFKMLKMSVSDTTSEMLNEIISDALFEDNIHNVRLNIMELLRYNDHLETSLINSSEKELYNIILNIESMTNEDKIKLYHSYKNKNMSTMFYIHLRTLRDMSYNQIKSELFVPSQNQQYLVDDIKKEFGIEVYDLRDKEYKMLVRVIGNQFDETTVHSSDSYTLISSDNNDVYGDVTFGSYVYGYNNFDISRIIHVYESDSFSGDVHDFEDSSHKINRIMTPDEVIDNRDLTAYSEIQIINEKTENGYKALKPSYIVCYDWISNEAYLESKKLNIPICIITHQYIKKDGIEGLSTETYKQF